MFKVEYEDKHPVKKNKMKKFLRPEEFDTQGKANRWMKKNSWTYGLKNPRVVMAG